MVAPSIGFSIVRGFFPECCTKGSFLPVVGFLNVVFAVLLE
jgi:hypothetical protein